MQQRPPLQSGAAPAHHMESMPFVSERAQAPIQAPAAGSGGRYEIEASLAKGGMGEVYRAIDTVTGQRVALKRVLDGGDHPVLYALFQLEYETLSRLRHPHIIEVFDYGVDQLGPYYTMELLDGHDLQSLGPQDYKTACRYLRDVAASLALLHTRRIVHRDLSPKNVRLTSDGRCKLIDFGAMAFVGLSADPVGTPPMLAPEVLAGVPLDHRVDLYAFGALSYWVLTGRHAYPASRIHDLQQTWHKAPQPPSAYDPRIPNRFDELVMSLLTLDPNGRPPSAAYVIEVLTAIGDLPPERSLDDARSYVAIPALVGRQRELGRGKELLAELKAGRGGRLLIESNPGVGRTRLLEELSLAARLSGLLVVDVDAGEHRGQLELARAVLRGLLDVGGQLLEVEVARRQTELLPLLPERARSGSPSRPPMEPADSWQLLADAFSDLVRQVTPARPMALMIDDVHRADEGSLSLLCELARCCEQVPLLIIATEEVAAVLAAGGALERFNRRVGGAEDGGLERGRRVERIRLHAMRGGETLDLVRGIFGDVPNSQRLARWMHAVSLGNVGQNIDLASHLVERGHLRYLDGTWVLAENIPNNELPQALRHALRKRVEQLSREARDLAESLSLLRGSFSFDQCLTLHGGTSSACLATMEELTGLGIVVGSPESYLFARELFRDLLLRDVNAHRIEDLHGRIADMLALSLPERIQAPGSNVLAELMMLALHELLGGRESAGLARFMQLSDLPMRAQTDLALAVDLARAADAALDSAAASTTVRLRVQAYRVEALVRAGEEIPSGFAEAVVGALTQQAGVGIALRLHPLLGRRLALGVATAARTVWRWFKPRSTRGLPTSQARRLLARTAVAAAMANMMRGRSASLRRLLLSLQIFAEGSQATFTTVAYLCVRALERFASGRFLRAIEHADSVCAAVEVSPESDHDTRDLWPAAMFVAAASEARTGNRRVLERCNELRAGEKFEEELLPLSLSLTAAYHRLRGEVALASPPERKLEMLLSHRTGGGQSRNLLMLGMRSSAAALVGDVLVLKECLEATAPVTRGDPEVEGLGEAVRIAYLLQGSRVAEAASTSERLLPRLKPFGSAYWLEARLTCASAFFYSGQVERTRALVSDTLTEAASEVAQGDYARVSLLLLLSDCETQLGRPESAAMRLDALSRELSTHGSPVLLGRVHERLARLTSAVDDWEGYARHLAMVRRHFEGTGHPLLALQAERVGDAQEARPVRSLAAPAAAVGTAMQFGKQQRSPFAGCDSPGARAERALTRVLERCGAHSGMLFLVQAEGLRLSARSGAVPNGTDYALLAREHVDAKLEKHTGTQGTSQRFFKGEVSGEAVHVLCSQHGGRLMVVGAMVVFGAAAKELRSPGRRLLGSLAEAFLSAGDVHVGADFQA